MIYTVTNEAIFGYFFGYFFDIDIVIYYCYFGYPGKNNIEG
jgi:hypothetical protein